jgi:hypothetical protein
MDMDGTLLGTETREASVARIGEDLANAPDNCRHRVRFLVPGGTRPHFTGYRN